MNDSSTVGGKPLNRGMITATVMMTSVLQTLDGTIANVALPKMMGSLSATQDQITWVLTSYIVAAAIMTPLTGWLAGQIGRKRLFTLSIIGFTISSALCGLAQTLPEIVLFRTLQGLSGAALVPMSQAVLFDINPPENHGKAMAIWGQGVLLGPLIGPILGGWLTDNYSWRWVFYINVPLGALAWMGILAYLPKGEVRRSRFDLFGFALLSLAIGAFQIMLDRGSLKDWFSSTEIWIEATLAGLAMYLFIVHSLTSRNPFIHLSMFKDPNFVAGNIFIFVVGIVLFSTLALVPPLLQNLMGYPVLDAGLLIAPRSVGSLIAMLIVGRLVGRVDPRLVIGGGFLFTAWSVWLMTRFNLQMDGRLVIMSGVLQGLGTGSAYVAMASLTFATLPPHLRNEGTAMFSLMRNIGSSIGISIVQSLLTSNTQIVHSTLSEHITPYNLAARNPEMAAQLASHAGTAALDGAVTVQAAMIAYLDDFQLMFILMMLTLPLLLMVRVKKTKGEDAPHVAIE
ncbi:MAG: DHA2 family efflux MFS transporter permease subunit [Rhizobium sp.]|nr:MAG: DHA2 family efflux MFS transporter permease subunit [Rhizobium sp.]